MPATRIHLVRHGEVDNPNGVLYGRLPNFALSAPGRQMAETTAATVCAPGHSITRLFSSPLLRTLQSARPFTLKLDIAVENEPEIIEPTNIFEGKKVGLETILRNPSYVFALLNPLRPSWGEPYSQIVKRMTQAMKKAWDETREGEVVMVSHQLPIWVVHLSSVGKPLWHDPRSRRCALSSVTSFEFQGNKLVEVDYLDPAKNASTKATDKGAV
jgi:broad specificity phosphatase PhoE